MYTSLDNWIARESISFALESLESLNAAVDQMIAALDSCVGLLALGEPMHGVDDFLILRNRIFRRLVESHNYTAIAIESSFPRGHVANDYVLGGAGDSFDAIAETGFSHGFGKSAANRELIEWMRRHNASVTDEDLKLQFHGFDAPTEMTGADSPRQLLHVALDFLDAIDGPDVGVNRDRRRRIDDLLGDDTLWSDPGTTFDASKSIGGTRAATALRIETENLIVNLSLRRPELAARDADGCARAVHHASQARLLLAYHAELANPASDRISRSLGIRDVMMAENLAYILERARGKVLAFAHNYHLKRSRARWQWGAEMMEWWPAGAHVSAMLGPRYAVIGAAVGALPAAHIGPPEENTLESHLSRAPGPLRLIPTRRGEHGLASAAKHLPLRPMTPANPGYFPLMPETLEEFDGLVVVG